MPERRLAEFCKNNSIDLVYPVDEFYARSQLQPDFLLKDGHPSARAHAAARSLLEWLEVHCQVTYDVSRIGLPGGP